MEDLLTEFEEKPYKWTWHDELTFTAFFIFAYPIWLVIEMIRFVIKFLLK